MNDFARYDVRGGVIACENGAFVFYDDARRYVEEAVRKAKEEQREEDCRAMCPFCQEGLPIWRDTSMNFRHQVKNGSFACAASAIRAGSCWKLRGPCGNQSCKAFNKVFEANCELNGFSQAKGCDEWKPEKAFRAGKVE